MSVMTARARAYAWYVLALLTAINLFNYVDRLVPNGMFDDMRKPPLSLSDGQIGSLWWAFFTVHAVTTIPFGWAADRFDRRKILAAGVIGWSLATLGSAFATGFVMLLMMRSLIGIGEACYGPVSNAILCEIFPPEQKARTIAIYNAGMFAGATIGGGVGAWLGFPTAFLAVATPGIILGLLVTRLKVPRVRADVPRVKPRFRSMYKDAFISINVRSLHWMLIAGVLISFAAGGYISWFIDFITRFKDMDAKQAAIVCGLITLTGGPVGVILGGVLADRLQRKRKSGRMIAIAMGFVLSVPFALGAIYFPRGIPWYITSWLLIAFIAFYNGPMAAVIDDVVDDDKAATAQATFSFVLHLIGTGPGGFFVGYVSQSWNLQNALLLPTIATALAAVFCLIASRHVGADMAAKEQRRAAQLANRAA
jgi:MFS transporter, Spinster family, sphingosine-1-phosphate transporter